MCNSMLIADVVLVSFHTKITCFFLQVFIKTLYGLKQEALVGNSNVVNGYGDDGKHHSAGTLAANDLNNFT